MEVCPDAGVIIQELSQRIASTGGAALIADYGHDGTKTDTLRVCVSMSHTGHALSASLCKILSSLNGCLSLAFMVFNFVAFIF